MALLSDNSDFQTAYFRIETGNDGDFYPQIIFENKDGLTETTSIRIAMSGGNAPTEVKIAMAKLWQAMESNGLNKRL